MSRRRSRSGWRRWVSSMPAARGLAECDWWRTDPTDEVAAEISAAQNISHARAVGQIQLRAGVAERLPEVAKVFARGVIDFRMVLDDHRAHRECRGRGDARAGCGDRPARREVDEAVGPEVARSGGSVGGQVRPGRGAGAAQDRRQPLCRDRADQCGDGRHLGPTFTPPTARRWISAWMRWPPRCASTIRAPRSSAAPMRAGRWRAVRPRWPASAGPTTARRPASARPPRPQR